MVFPRVVRPSTRIWQEGVSRKETIMPEHDPTTEGLELEEGSKEFNFQKLKDDYEAKLAARDAELEELRPLRNIESVRQAGFDPDSDRGKALDLALKAGAVTADPEQIREYATSTFGWEPAPVLTENEQAQVDAQARLDAARGGTDSEPPPNIDNDIAQAEADGDWMKSGALKVQKAFANKI